MTGHITFGESVIRFPESRTTLYDLTARLQRIVAGLEGDGQIYALGLRERMAGDQIAGVCVAIDRGDTLDTYYVPWSHDYVHEVSYGWTYDRDGNRWSA